MRESRASQHSRRVRRSIHSCHFSIHSFAAARAVVGCCAMFARPQDFVARRTAGSLRRRSPWCCVACLLAEPSLPSQIQPVFLQIQPVFRSGLSPRGPSGGQGSSCRRSGRRLHRRPRPCCQGQGRHLRFSYSLPLLGGPSRRAHTPCAHFSGRGAPSGGLMGPWGAVGPAPDPWSGPQTPPAGGVDLGSP